MTGPGKAPAHDHTVIDQFTRQAVVFSTAAAMIDLAERRCARAGLANTAFQVGDITALPFPDGSATVVVCRYALHHVLDPAHAFEYPIAIRIGRRPPGTSATSEPERKSES